MTFFTKDISRCLYFYEQIFDLQVHWIKETPYLFIGGKRIAFEEQTDMKKTRKQEVFNLTCTSELELEAFKQKAEFYYYRMYERGRRSSKKFLLWDLEGESPWVQAQDPDGRVWRLQANRRVNKSERSKNLSVVSTVQN